MPQNAEHPDNHFVSQNIINRWYALSYEAAQPSTLRDALEILRDACLNKLCDPDPCITEPRFSLDNISTGEDIPPWVHNMVRVMAASRALDHFYEQPESQQDPATRALCDATVTLFHETAKRNTTQAERDAQDQARQTDLALGGRESPSTLSIMYLNKD